MEDTQQNEQQEETIQREFSNPWPMHESNRISFRENRGVCSFFAAPVINLDVYDRVSD